MDKIQKMILRNQDKNAFDRMQIRERCKLWDETSVAKQVRGRINRVLATHAPEAEEPCEANGWVY